MSAERHQLYDHQIDAVENLANGKILWGGVGSGKSITALTYYLEKEAPKDVIVITTAKKRDSLDWEGEAARLGIGFGGGPSVAGNLTVDSWNNITKYTDVRDAFFVFDEQRLVGTGVWVRSFLKIAKRNNWILLSATPGDTWLDYAPVFIANGWYKNITDFKMQHVRYEPYSKYPKIRGYLGEGKLDRYRNEVLVEMPYMRHTERFLNYLDVDYDRELYKRVTVDRWNPYLDEPIKDVAEMFRLMRRVVNSDPSKLEMVKKLLTCHDRLVVFYNFNYELDILRTLSGDYTVAEWNGHKKQPVPDTDKWVYLVQYVAGAEGWNCTSTDAMCLYSLTYSYKNFEQAQGRIDRLNTSFMTLYYYILVSDATIDHGVRAKISAKQSFNEREFWLEQKKKGLLGDVTEGFDEI